MKQLIVNADDFGLTGGVNRGILHAHAEGIVTSTTLLANGDAFDAAVAICRQYPGLAVGAHLNLTQGAAVSPHGRIASLVDARGNFRFTPPQLWTGMLSRKIRPDEIEIELRAQVKKIFDAELTPSHLDGHMHVHVLPGVAERVVRIAREFGIPAVRCPRETKSSIFLRPRNAPRAQKVARRRAIGLAVSFFARKLRTRLDRAGLAHSGHFFGTAQTGLLNVPVLLDLLRSLPDGTSELCCHPGYLGADMAEFGGELTTQREIEVQALTAPEAKALIAAQGIRLINYRDLAGRSS